MQDKLIFANSAGWGKLGHFYGTTWTWPNLPLYILSLDLPWPNLPQVKKYINNKKQNCSIFFKRRHFLQNYWQATKTFCFCGKPGGKCLNTKSQLIRTKSYRDNYFTKIQLKIKMNAIYLKKS